MDTLISLGMALACGVSAASVAAGALAGARRNAVSRRWAWGVSASVGGGLALLVVASAAGFFELAFGQLVSPVFMTYTVLVGAGAVWCARSKHVGRALAAIPIHWLVATQTLRIVGGVLLLEHARGAVPSYFALTVGSGDVIAGLTAPFVALIAYRRLRGWWFVTAGWTLYAIGDLIHSAIAATLSVDTPLKVLPDLTPVLVRLPVVLLIVFLVPIAFIWCVATFRRLGQLREETRAVSG